MAFCGASAETAALLFRLSGLNSSLHFLEQSSEGIAKFERSQQAISKVIKQWKEQSSNSSN